MPKLLSPTPQTHKPVIEVGTTPFFNNRAPKKLKLFKIELIYRANKSLKFPAHYPRQLEIVNPQRPCMLVLLRRYTRKRLFR